MKYNISDYRLKAIVDELGEEYKDLLIERILDDMHEIDADQINYSDLIRLDVSTKFFLRRDEKKWKQNRICTIVFLLGVIYAMLGLMILMWSNQTIRDNQSMKMSVILLFIGLFAVLFALVCKKILRMRSQSYRGPRHTILPYEVVNKWKEMEALVHQLTPEENEFSLSSMLSNLKNTKIISDKDVEAINRLLNVRNQVVHGRDKNIKLSQSELRSILMQANEIISKMKRLV